MRYPNLRYGNPTEMQYYAIAYALHDLARRLRRDERTVKDWLSGRQRVPFWVPELLRLWQAEHLEFQRRSGFENIPVHLGGVTRAGVIELHRMDVKKPQPMTALRLDEFDVSPGAISSVA